MKKVMIVFGTRPEAIKMCPLINELKTRRNEFCVTVCVTGQHLEMLQSVIDAFGVVPDYNLRVMQKDQTLFDITGRVLDGMRHVLENEQPDVVLVHGDTTTSFAASLACFYSHIPIGHVEAGLRTHDINNPWPEEFNRQAVDIISQYYFAPTESARQNLLYERKPSNSIWVTGNTGIDALATTIRTDYSHPLLDWAGSSRLILLTAHRRESLGQPMRNMFRAVRRALEAHPGIKVLYPVHLNPVVQSIAHEEFDELDRLRLTEPLEVIDFHNILARCYCVLTDSGGIQEEAPSLGKPVLVMRQSTERPEGAEAGTLRLVGTDEDVIFNSLSELLVNETLYKSMAHASNPYGDGRASKRIADVLSKGSMDNDGFSR